MSTLWKVQASHQKGFPKSDDDDDDDDAHGLTGELKVFWSTRLKDEKNKKPLVEKGWSIECRYASEPCLFLLNLHINLNIKFLLYLPIKLYLWPSIKRLMQWLQVIQNIFANIFEVVGTRNKSNMKFSYQALAFGENTSKRSIHKWCQWVICLFSISIFSLQKWTIACYLRCLNIKWSCSVFSFEIKCFSKVFESVARIPLFAPGLLFQHEFIV